MYLAISFAQPEEAGLGLFSYAEKHSFVECVSAPTKDTWPLQRSAGWQQWNPTLQRQSASEAASHWLRLEHRMQIENWKWLNFDRIWVKSGHKIVTERTILISVNCWHIVFFKALNHFPKNHPLIIAKTTRIILKINTDHHGHWTFQNHQKVLQFHYSIILSLLFVLIKIIIINIAWLEVSVSQWLQRKEQCEAHQRPCDHGLGDPH